MSHSLPCIICIMSFAVCLFPIANGALMYKRNSGLELEIELRIEAWVTLSYRSNVSVISFKIIIDFPYLERR